MFLTGQRLPKGVCAPSMVSIGDKVVLMGGYTTNGPHYYNEIYSLDCLTCDWKTEVPMLNERYLFVAVLVPDVFNAYCTKPTTTTIQYTVICANIFSFGVVHL